MSKEYAWATQDIEEIKVGLHRDGVALVGDNIETKRRARSIVEGQFLMPFAAAVVLIRKSFSWDDYDLLGTPQADDLADKVFVVHNEKLEGLRHPFGASLEVKARGSLHRLDVLDPDGEPHTFPDVDAGAKSSTSL